MDDNERFIPRSGAMFSRTSLAKADMATNLAIPLLAEGGWSAVTLRTVARAGNVTPQAIAAWFPSVTAMRAAIAGRYGQRWIAERGRLARHRILLSRLNEETVELPHVALALLPETWLEEVFDGVWLTVVEAGRWDEAIGSAVGTVLETEVDLVAEMVADLGGRNEAQFQRDVDLVVAIVRGLRVGLTSPHDAMSIDRAAEVLHASLSGAR